MLSQNLAVPLSALALALTLALPAAFAQTPTAQITGRITDESGAVIPGATINVTNLQTGVDRSTVSNDSGNYVVPLLPPGNYRILAQKDGFRSAGRDGVTLVVQQVARLDFALEVGVVTETVEVTSAAPLLEADTSSIGQLVDNRKVQELPLKGRNPYALVSLVPGARVPVSWQNLPMDMNSTQYAVINGARGNQNEFLIDGIPNTNSVSQGPNIFPSPDSVQEFKVETNNLSAEYGRAAGGVFNVVTKSGTNQFHGSLYEFHRNENINANNFFANRAGRDKPAFTFNQFGGSVGGPIIKDRTFFFTSLELARQREGVVFLSKVPTALERVGDFSNLRNSAGDLISVHDPLSTRSDPNTAGASIRDPFAGNRIPLSRQNPASLGIQQYIPEPNAPGAPFTNNENFLSANPLKSDKDVYLGKIDHAFSDSHRISGSFHYDDSPWIRPNAFDNIASPTRGPQTFARRGVVLDDTLMLGPKTIVNFRYGLSRMINERLPLSDGFDITQLGFSPQYAAQQRLKCIPEITIQGYPNASSAFSQGNVGPASYISACDLIFFGLDTHSGNINLTTVRGRHSLKAGFESRVIRSNTWQVTEKRFNFTNAFTQGPNPAQSSSTAGDGYASFLLGSAAGGFTQFSPAIAAQYLYYAGFVQDSVRMSSKLTLNLGMRYEYSVPRTDRFDQLTNFDFNSAVPLDVPGLNARGALAFPGTNGLSRGQTNPDRNNWAPRFGLAYQLSQKTVIRGGLGVFYAPLQSGTGAGGLSGYSASTAFVASLDGLTPINSLDDPHPDGVVQPTGNSLGASTLLGQAVSFVTRNEVTPYSLQWNFDIQHQLPGNLLFDIAYIGSRGVKLASNRTLNQLPDSALALGDSLREQVDNPFYGQIDQGALAQPTVSRAQLLRPFPHFTGVTATQSGFGNSSYHALQTKFEKRFSQGLTFLSSYTYSKLIDDVGGPFAGEATGAAGIQNWNDLRAERAVSSFDQPHSLVFSYIYELPFGPGKGLLSNAKGALAKIVGGWQIQGVASFQSGSPIGVSAPNNTFSQGGGQRPNSTGVSADLGSDRTLEEWFDTSQFTAPAPYTFGNAARSYGDVRAHGNKNFDFTLAKNTSINERVGLQFRVELFNAMNTPRFGVPGRTLNTGAFGRVSSQLNTPRVIQLGLKLLF